MKIYTGWKASDGKIIDKSKFVVFGEMSDGSKCYHELDVCGHEKTDFWFSMSIMRINGKSEKIFFLEGC